MILAQEGEPPWSGMWNMSMIADDGNVFMILAQEDYLLAQEIETDNGNNGR